VERGSVKLQETVSPNVPSNINLEGISPPEFTYHFMKFTTKTDYVLEDETFMVKSKDVETRIAELTKKRGKAPSSKDVWRIIDSQIKKKLKKRKSVIGVCMCDEGTLCKHRMRYLRKALNG